MFGVRAVCAMLISVLALPSFVHAVSVNIDASVPDTTPPTVTVTAPEDTASFTTTAPPTSVTGTAADNNNGIGLAANSTTFSLQRSSDEKYWNGVAWVSGVTFLGTSHPATNQNEVVTWTLSVSLPSFSADTYTIIARAVDRSDNATTSSPVSFIVAAEAVSPVTKPVQLAAPVITSPSGGELVGTATPTITGTGTPGATVHVTIVETGDQYDVAVDAAGDWSVVAATPLLAGSYTATAYQTLSGQTSGTDQQTFRIGLPPPVITSPTNGVVIMDTTPTVTGTGIPGATVTVTVQETGNQYQTTVNPDGSWSLTIDSPLATGKYTLQAFQAAQGLTSPASSVVVTIRIVAATTITGYITTIPGSQQANTALITALALSALTISLLPALLQLPIGLPIAPPLFNLFNLFLGWLHRRRKYGLVYDSVSREGIPDATVRLFAEGGTQFEQGKLLETKTTDEHGEYTFNVEEGQYRIEVVCPDYSFPSKRASIDYRGEVQHADDGLYHPDVPLDALTPQKHHAFVNFRRLGDQIQRLRIPVMVIGTILAVAYLIERTQLVDVVIVALYVALWIFELLQYLRARNVAYVMAHGHPVPFTVLRIFDVRGRLRMTRVSNLAGQYSMFVSKGVYLLDANRDGYDVQSHEVRMKTPGVVFKTINLRELPRE